MGVRAARGGAKKTPAQPVIIDTDIGDDIDGAFAVGLALSSPELKILGITSAWGDTALRARLLDRLLCDTGRVDIPVAGLIQQPGPGQAGLTQAPWAPLQPTQSHPCPGDLLPEASGVCEEIPCAVPDPAPYHAV